MHLLAFLVTAAVLIQARPPGIDPDRPDPWEIITFPPDPTFPPVVPAEANITSRPAPTTSRRADLEHVSYVFEIIGGTLGLLLFIGGGIAAAIKFRRQIAQDPEVVLPALRGLAVAILALLRRLPRQR